MVDQHLIRRHLIVEKKNEVTQIQRAEKSRIQDEQVLYAAVGYSIFETLKQNNVIFEGWKDKEIFRVAAEAMSKTDKTLKESLATIGMTFAEGVKDVKHVANFLELASRNCLILSDADKPAYEKRKQYVKIGAWGKWVTLRDVLGDSSTIATGEDLILPSAILKRANKWRTSISGLNAIEADALAERPKITVLQEWVTSAGLNADELIDAMASLKDALFLSLKRDEISDDSEKLVRYVINHYETT